MIVYKFLNETRALEAVRDRRLKLSLINDLNDPFEFLAVSLRNKKVRHQFNIVKAKLSTTIGILCFSTHWSSPLLWSHYANRHKGACLGFEVRNELLDSMDYTTKRIVLDADWLIKSDDERVSIMRRLLRTKFKPWEYESEVRMFARLNEIDVATGLYFKEFAPDLTLTQVIIGASSRLTRRQLNDALGAETTEVQLVKARAAFKSFNIVPDKRGLQDT